VLGKERLICPNAGGRVLKMAAKIKVSVERKPLMRRQGMHSTAGERRSTATGKVKASAQVSGAEEREA